MEGVVAFVDGAEGLYHLDCWSNSTEKWLKRTVCKGATLTVVLGQQGRRLRLVWTVLFGDEIAAQELRFLMPNAANHQEDLRSIRLASSSIRAPRLEEDHCGYFRTVSPAAVE